MFFLTGIKPPAFAAVILFVFWATAFFLDARITVSSKKFMMYESNPIFRYLIGRFSVKTSVAVQAAVEVALAMMMCYVLEARIEIGSLGIISSVLGSAHMMAWYSNKRFLSNKRIA